VVWWEWNGTSSSACESIQAKPTGSQRPRLPPSTKARDIQGQEPGGDNAALQQLPQSISSNATASKHRGEAARVLGRLDGKGGPEATAADGDGILIVAGGSGAGHGHGPDQPTGGVDQPRQVAGGRRAGVASEAAHPRGGRRGHGGRGRAGRRARRAHGHARARRRGRAPGAAAAAWGRPQGLGLLQASAGTYWPGPYAQPFRIEYYALYKIRFDVKSLG